MADTTPVANALHIKLMALLDDNVTAGGDNGLTAATNGGIFTAQVRNNAFNEAYAWIVQEAMKRFGIEGAANAVQGAVKTQAISAFSSSGVTLNKDFIAPIRLVKSDNSVFQYMRKYQFDSDTNPYIDNGFTVENGLIYAYQRTAGVMTILNTGAGTLYYLKADRKSITTGADVAVNTAPDTTLDYAFMDSALWYTAHLLAHAKGAAEWTVKADKFLGLALEKFPQGA